MKRNISFYLSMFFLIGAIWSCSTDDQGVSTTDILLNQSAIDIAQTSGQLASGTSFVLSGSSTDSTASVNTRPHRHGRKGKGKHRGILDGLNLLAPTDELLAIVDAESASDIRGLKISKNGGATITHYQHSWRNCFTSTQRQKWSARLQFQW